MLEVISAGVRMTTIDSIGNIPTIQNGNVVNNQPKVNFRASAQMDNPVDSFISEQEKAKKKAKKQQNLNAAVQVALLGLFGVITAVTVKQAKMQGVFKKAEKQLSFKDLSKELSLSEMALPESQKKAAERVANRIEHYDEIIKKGGKKGTAILFYGPPGTGKNTFAYAITKKFPNAKFLDMDISKMNSKWHGESEQNILGTMEATIKYAKEHPSEKVFVFLDEIDSVMMQDRSSGAKLSQDILNAFKKGFNSLTGEKNIIVMGATNLKLDPKKAMMEGKILDTAMVDRFAQKVLVDLPTKDQIKEGIQKFYQNSERTMVDDAMKDINNPKWDKIADFLSKDERQTSFRKLTDILGTAAESSEVGKNVTFDDVIRAIKTNQNTLYATDAEMQAFLNSVK